MDNINNDTINLSEDTEVKKPPKIFYGRNKEDNAWGFFIEGDNRLVDEILIDDETRLRLLDEESTGKQIVCYNNEVFTSEFGKYYVDDNNKWQKRTDEEFEEIKTQTRNEYIKTLTMTKRVLALQLQQLGVSYNNLKELLAQNEQAQLEWDLCERLERSNPLLDIMGAQLGITPEQIDNMFLLAKEQEKNNV